MLDAQEADGLGAPTPVANLIYRMMGEVRSVPKVTKYSQGTEYSAAEEVPTWSFQQNDVAVPIWSGQAVGPFVHIRTLKKNHASIASPDVALEVANLVRRAQPLRLR